MAIGIHISVITVNLNELNTQSKHIDWLNGYNNKTYIYIYIHYTLYISVYYIYSLQEIHFSPRDTYRQKVR